MTKQEKENYCDNPSCLIQNCDGKHEIDEEQEVKADLYRKYDYPAEQESIDRNE
jgi:hypothetical protein